MSARRKVYISENEFDMIDRAAFWEGFKSPSTFIETVMRRHIEQRQADRGSPYGKTRWPRNTAHEEEEED